MLADSVYSYVIYQEKAFDDISKSLELMKELLLENIE